MLTTKITSEEKQAILERVAEIESEAKAIRNKGMENWTKADQERLIALRDELKSLDSFVHSLD